MMIDGKSSVKRLQLKDVKIEIAILVLVGLVFNAITYASFNGFHIKFFDTDDYMRLVRIREFFSHFDLSNNIITRGNVPFGCSLHWTRFYDFFLIIPSYILSFFTNSINEAIEYVGFCISPCVKIVSAIVMFRMLDRVMDRFDAFLCAAIFISHILLLQFGSFGRPDHHAFIRLFMLLFISGVMELLSTLETCDQPEKLTRKCLLVALLASLCLWISPETLITILLVNALLWVAAFYRQEGWEWLLFTNLMTSFFVGVIILDTVRNNLVLFALMMVLLAMVAIFLAKGNFIDGGAMLPLALLLLSIPFSKDIAVAEYDKISIVHFAMFICGSIFWGCGAFVSGLSWPIARKIKMCVVAAIVLGGVFLFPYPKFIWGMEAEISDYLKEIWLNKVQEMQSPLAAGNVIFYSSFSCITIAAIYYKVRELVTDFGCHNECSTATCSESIRLLSKQRYFEEFIGAYGAQDRSVHVVHEDPSTEATQK
ncbi:MAG: hypothetical protein LBJ16_03580, partial [Holosporaceae bacterium]|nr:hypothetical protein [Holosporaceae bacterium]